MSRVRATLWAVMSRFELVPLLVAAAAGIVMTWLHYAKVPLIKR